MFWFCCFSLRRSKIVGGNRPGSRRLFHFSVELEFLCVVSVENGARVVNRCHGTMRQQMFPGERQESWGSAWHVGVHTCGLALFPPSLVSGVAGFRPQMGLGSCIIHSLVSARDQRVAHLSPVDPPRFAECSSTANDSNSEGFHGRVMSACLWEKKEHGGKENHCLLLPLNRELRCVRFRFPARI